MNDDEPTVDRYGLRRDGFSILWHVVKILAVVALTVVALGALASHDIMFAGLVPAALTVALLAALPNRGVPGELPRAIARSARL